MTKKEKILIVILGAIALLIIGYNAYINAKNKGVDVNVTIDRTASDDISNDDLENSETNSIEEIDTYENKYDRYDEYERLVEKSNYVNIQDRVVDVYSDDEEAKILENEINNSDYNAEHIYTNSSDNVDKNENEDDSSQE